MTNIPNILSLGTDNPVQLFEKDNISNNFQQELVRSCILRISKRTTKEAPAGTNFCFSFDNH